jgi:outer membrane protein assembly factor BamB
MGTAQNQDTIYCFNAQTGQAVWQHTYSCPRATLRETLATPTVDGEVVYTLSSEGQAFCLDAVSGNIVWSKDLSAEFGVERPPYGFSGSPLVEGNLAVFNAGTAGLALDKSTGKLMWQSVPGRAAQASPVSYGQASQRAIVFFAESAVVGVNASDGRQLWRFAWPFDRNAADPIVFQDTLFISSFQRGGVLARLGKGTPAIIWSSKMMRNHFNTCILLDGYLYGNDMGALKCVELNTGNQQWQQAGIGDGTLIAAGGNLIVLTERGALRIVKASPKQYTELASAQVIGGRCFALPVLAHGRIYCRNEDGELICLDVSGESKKYAKAHK